MKFLCYHIVSLRCILLHDSGYKKVERGEPRTYTAHIRTVHVCIEELTKAIGFSKYRVCIEPMTMSFTVAFQPFFLIFSLFAFSYRSLHLC